MPNTAHYFVGVNSRHSSAPRNRCRLLIVSHLLSLQFLADFAECLSQVLRIGLTLCVIGSYVLARKRIWESPNNKKAKKTTTTNNHFRTAFRFRISLRRDPVSSAFIYVSRCQPLSCPGCRDTRIFMKSEGLYGGCF